MEIIILIIGLCLIIGLVVREKGDNTLDTLSKGFGSLSKGCGCLFLLIILLVILLVILGYQQTPTTEAREEAARKRAESINEEIKDLGVMYTNDQPVVRPKIVKPKVLARPEGELGNPY